MRRESREAATGHECLADRCGGLGEGCGKALLTSTDGGVFGPSALSSAVAETIGRFGNFLRFGRWAI